MNTIQKSACRTGFRPCGIIFVALAGILLAGCSSCPTGAISLFDGKNLGNWQISDFFWHGDVYTKKSSIILEEGGTLTGVTWQGEVPARMNYEITLEAMRLEGDDFFCGLTVPVDSNCCSLILGGWGGETCGISSLDGQDANNNETKREIAFESERWYKVRLRITPGRIRAWLDNEQIIDVDTTGREIGIRSEVDLSQPLGIASYQTTAAIHNICLKKLE